MRKSKLISSNANIAAWFVSMDGRETLQIRFKSGRVYNYSPVKEEKYDELLKSDSHGKWVNKNLVQNKKIECKEVV